MGRVVLGPALLVGVIVAGCSMFESTPRSERLQNAYRYLNSGDERRAYMVFDSLADAGDANAQFAIGYMYEKGLIYTGMLTQEVDYGRAASWYRRAAEQGHAAAQSNLGRLYVGGQGVNQDLAAAANWYRKAAVQGFATAQYNLGIRYFEGTGVARNDLLAHMWASLAAAGSSGSTQRFAANLRDSIAARMSPEALSEAKALAKDWRPGTEPAVAGAASDGRGKIAAGGADADVEGRLKRLKSLRDKGLITDSDYAARRTEILRDL